MPSALWRKARTSRGGTALAEAPAAVTTWPDAAGWRAIPLPEVPASGLPPTIRALAIGQEAPAPHFAAIAGAGLWRSLDAGASWAPCEGLPGDVYALRTGPKGLVVAGHGATAAGSAPTPARPGPIAAGGPWRRPGRSGPSRSSRGTPT